MSRRSEDVMAFLLSQIKSGAVPDSFMRCRAAQCRCGGPQHGLMSQLTRLCGAPALLEGGVAVCKARPHVGQHRGVHCEAACVAPRRQAGVYPADDDIDALSRPRLVHACSNVYMKIEAQAVFGMAASHDHADRLFPLKAAISHASCLRRSVGHQISSRTPNHQKTTTLCRRHRCCR